VSDLPEPSDYFSQTPLDIIFQGSGVHVTHPEHWGHGGPSIRHKLSAGPERKLAVRNFDYNEPVQLTLTDARGGALVCSSCRTSCHSCCAYDAITERDRFVYLRAHLRVGRIILVAVRRELGFDAGPETGEVAPDDEIPSPTP
jgi:hypothetical protein